jgi:hypothetical protein
MIDKMIRCKGLNAIDEIESLHEWFYKCPPQGKMKHWKDGRSAKETAKHWAHTIPQSFKDLLVSKQLKYILCSPEYVSTFDTNGGNGRNHDLLILAKDKGSNKVIVSIESKVDESFGDTVAKTIASAKKAKDKNNKSKASERVNELREVFFGERNDNQLELRYQLLTAVAGTIAEAKKQGANSAYFLVQTFVSDEINDNKHKQNQKDLNDFLSVFTKENYSKIENKDLLGPFKIETNNEYLSSDIDLWIGKYEIEI